jgi:hypothetical protein
MKNVTRPRRISRVSQRFLQPTSHQNTTTRPLHTCGHQPLPMASSRGRGRSVSHGQTLCSRDGIGDTLLMEHYQNVICQIVRRCLASLAWLTLAVVPALRADVMLRYKNEITLNAHLPQQFVEQMMKGVKASLSSTQIQQLRNGKLLSALGNLSSITDFDKREITLLDAAGKRYATVPADRFGEEIARALPPMPAASDGPRAIKTHTESKVTGRTEAIQGVEGEEHEITVTMDGPPLPNVPPGPMMRIVMHVWTAKASEAGRIPAIGELMRYDWSAAGMDPVSILAKTFEQMPGVGDIFAAVTKVRSSAGSPVILKMQNETYMPMIAGMMASMTAGGDAAARGFDMNEPLARIKYELAEISTAPIPDSVFQIPEGYQSALASEILKEFLKDRMAAAK